MITYFLFLFVIHGLSSDKYEVLCATSYNKATIELKIPVSEIKTLDIKPSVDKNSRSFTRLSLPGAGISDKTGAPELPVIRKFVAIPVCADVNFESRVLKKETLILSAPLYPRQPPISKSSLSGAKDFIINQEDYTVDAFLPQDRVRIVRISEIQGIRVLVIEIYPVVYNAPFNKLELATEMEITLKFTSPDWHTTQKKFSRFNNCNSGQKLILNYDSYKKLTYSGFKENKNLSLPIGYLIIVPDEYYTNVIPLKDWKTQKGYYTTVTRLSEIPDSTPAGIVTYINQAYTGWSVPPTFVLLVGDTDKIGYFTYVSFENVHTDLNYSLMDTMDYFPDLYVSRFSVANTSQLDSLVQKTIKYEKSDWSSDSSWCRNGYFIASSDMENHQIAESTHIYCMEKCRSYGMFCDSLWLYSSPSGTPIATAVNNGASWVIYSGHGGATLWQDPGFSVSNVHSLSNTDKIPFTASFACNTGNFTVGECFTESWIRTGYRGAIVSLGSSVSSFWEEDDYLQRRMFDIMFDSGQTWIMGGVNTAKLFFYQYFGDIPITHEYFAMYNLMGDGSIDIYSDIPHPITVDYSKKIPIGICTLSVFVKDNGTPVNEALVCIKTDSIYAGYTDSTGNAMLFITTTQPCTGLITVTGHNLKTYEGSLAIVGEEELGPGIMPVKLRVFPNPAIKGQDIEFVFQSINSIKGNLTLKIYDLSGRAVRSFTVSPETKTSIAMIKWARDDDYGKKIRAGIYFYKLQSDPVDGEDNKPILNEKTSKLVLL